MDDITWVDRIDLFLWPLLSAICAGIVLPMVGSYLFVRRTSFHGIVLPQFAAAGVVFAYAILGWWIETIGLGGLTLDAALHDPHAASTFGLIWGAIFTLGGILMLVTTGQRGGSETARAAAGFAAASAAVLILGRMSPIGRGPVDELLQGEVLGVGVHEFELLATALIVVAAALIWFGRDLLLTSFDRETAVVLGKRATSFEVLFHTLVGLAVAAGTLTLGPILVFGLLVLPPFAARRWARSMPRFVAISAGIGLVSAIAGEAAALEWDLPVGPSVVMASVLLCLPGLIARRGG